MKISGVILSAGRCSRQGGPKALLKIGDRTLLQRVSDAMKESGLCDEILVVTGYDRDAVQVEAERCGLRTIFNPHASEDIMRSLQTGLQAVSPTSDAALVTLVDQPMMNAELILSLSEGFQSAGEFSLARHASLIPRKEFDFYLRGHDEPHNFIQKKGASEEAPQSPI